MNNANDETSRKLHSISFMNLFSALTASTVENKHGT